MGFGWLDELGAGGLGVLDEVLQRRRVLEGLEVDAGAVDVLRAERMAHAAGEVGDARGLRGWILV